MDVKQNKLLKKQNDVLKTVLIQRFLHVQWIFTLNVYKTVYNSYCLIIYNSFQT